MQLRNSRWCFTRDLEDKVKESVTTIPLLLPESPWVLYWQPSSRETASTGYWNPVCHKALGREYIEKSLGLNSRTPLQQTVNKPKRPLFSCQTWLTRLNTDLDSGPLIHAELGSVHISVPRAEQDEQDDDQRSDRALI